jgi:CRISPR system Cascade subunit CasB
MTLRTQDTQGLASLIGSIAVLIESSGLLNAGDVAALRRMDPRSPPAAFFKIAGLVLDGRLPAKAESLLERETRWAAIVNGLAHLGARHSAGRRLGGALAEAGFSELRFARLLRADEERLVDELPSLARFLAAKDVPVDWTEAGSLILSAGGPNEEGVRRAIARDYYGALARLSSSASSSKEP